MRVAGTNYEKGIIVWGILDIVDDSAAYAPRSEDSPPKLNPAFDVGDANTQVRMLKMCEVLRNRTDLVAKFSDPCPMETIKTAGESLGFVFPFTSDQMVYIVATIVKTSISYGKIFGLEELENPATGATVYRISWMRLNFLTSIPFRTSSVTLEKEYFRWLEFLDEVESTTFQYNKTTSGNWTMITAPPSESARPKVTAMCWVRMATELQAIRGTAGSIGVSLAFAVFATLLFTGDLVVATIALLSMSAIILAVIAVLVALKVEFGIVEAISLTILVGISVDFSLHLAEAFTRSHFTSRGIRGVDAVSRVGYPIFSAALTTMSAVIPMLYCKIQVLVRFGQIIPVCIVMSLLYGLHFFAPMLMALGPNAPGGGAGKWCCYMGKLPNFLFATQTRRLIFLIVTGLIFGVTLPATRALLLDDGGGAYATLVVGFSCLAAVAITTEECCRRRRESRERGESPAPLRAARRRAPRA